MKSVALAVALSVDGTIVARWNHDYWIEHNVRTCYCALDSNDAWNWFEGGTLDLPSLSKNISHRVKLKNKKNKKTFCCLHTGSLNICIQSINQLDLSPIRMRQIYTRV